MREMKAVRNIPALIAFCGGIVTAAFIGASPLWWLLILLAVLAGGFILFIFNRRIAGWMLLAGLFCMGGFLFGLARGQFNAQIQRNLGFTKQRVTLEGILIQRPEATVYGVKMILQVKPRRGPAGKIMVSYPGKIPSHWYGRRLQVSGKFKSNPGVGTGFPEYLEQAGIAGSIFSKEKPVLLNRPGLPNFYIWANRLRELMISRGRKYLQPANARLLEAMIFNENLRVEVSERRQVNDLRRTGTIHLVSVSGLHVWFLMAGFNWFLGCIHIPKRGRILPTILLVWFYIMMTGMNPPVLRAGIMMLIYFVSNVLETRSGPLNQLSLAALILLFWNPYYLFEASFQLSFGATFGVVWLFPLLKECFADKKTLLNWFREAFLVSIAAQFTVLPIIVYYFQQIAWISPVANLLFFLPAEVIVIGGLVGEGIALIIPWLGQGLLWVVDLNLTIIRWIAHCLAIQSWAASWSPVWPWPWMAGYYLALLLCLDSLRPNSLTKKRQISYGWIIIGILAVLNFIIWAGFLHQSQGRYMQLSVIDVGQGDALLVQTPDGCNLLIDGGDQGKGISRVIPFLRSVGVERLSLVIVSHGHRDHISGLTEVLEEVPAEKICLPINTASPEVREFMERIQTAPTTYLPVFPGEQFRLGTEVRGEILAAPEADDENNRSWVIVIQYGKNKLLLTGDLGEKGEAILTRKYPRILRALVLKIGHHGSNYASGLSFLSQVKPKVAIISVGAGNSFGHPGSRTINRLRSLGINVFRTDRQGTVTVKLYGSKFKVSAGK